MPSRPLPAPNKYSTMSARYTHRVAISNSRLLNIEDGHVAFRWKDYGHHSKQKIMTLTVMNLSRRFLLHTLSPGLQRIRLLRAARQPPSHRAPCPLSGTAEHATAYGAATRGRTSPQLSKPLRSADRKILASVSGLPGGRPAAHRSATSRKITRRPRHLMTSAVSTT